MARLDLRVQAWAWFTRKTASVAGKSEQQVIALQSRSMPDSPVTNWIFGTRAPGVSATDRTIPGPAGDIPVRIYQSGTGGPDRPLVLYFHGGGFVFGMLRMGDWMCGQVAASVGAVVVSVDYRLAPTHRFPAAVEDCYAALTWAAENAAELGAQGPIGVMGESAGGNLSAVIALAARDRGGPAIAHQALIYPAVDMTEAGMATASKQANPNAPILSGDEMTAFRKLYLGDADRSSPLASPLLAESHEGLPPALVQVGEHDPLHDDGVRYAKALRAAGVPVRLTDYVGMPHGFMNFPGLCREAPQAMAEIIAEQRAVLCGQAVA